MSLISTPDLYLSEHLQLDSIQSLASCHPLHYQPWRNTQTTLFQMHTFRIPIFVWALFRYTVSDLIFPQTFDLKKKLTT